MAEEQEGPDFSDEEDAPPSAADTARFSQAVLYASDWTVETIISQLERANIELNPDFQRRDAWSPRAKGRFIESIILGLPIPQLVLAERLGKRGQYIVLDGKQRLLSLMQFTGKFFGPQNGFRLSGLEVRTDLAGVRYAKLSTSLPMRDDLNVFLNHTIRTVVIRNWPGMEFLHLLFLRLNTGSLKLSAQELRQALIPGKFSKFVDIAASNSSGLKTVFARSTPDPRMRDVELLVRFLSFQNFINDYGGRMKKFLDTSCEVMNQRWGTYEPILRQQVASFDSAVSVLLSVFNPEGLARRAGSVSFNRAIFDVLVFYAADGEIGQRMLDRHEEVKMAYAAAIADPDFVNAVESDTAGVPHTYERFSNWGKRLSEALDLNFRVPELFLSSDSPRIRFMAFH